MCNNHIVVDLNKVQWARYGYKNQYGQFSKKKPKFSVFGLVRDPVELALNKTETLLEQANRLHLTDKWTPNLLLQLTANHSLTYTGDKAISIWWEWSRRIFKKDKNK